jgi:ribonucleoside-diphosphate reductase alpha chain
MQIGPLSPLSMALHGQKYRGPQESFEEFANRVSFALSDDPAHYHQFRQRLMEQSTMPAGRVQAAAGSLRNITMFNCFVSGQIEDTFVDAGGIMDRAKEAATTMRMGGGIGYNFGTLRPENDLIRKLGSRSSGPIMFMGIFNEVCKATASAGNRRGAQMGVFPINHPDIEKFIHVKQNQDKLTGFNISVGITNEFMDCLKTGRPFPLTFKGEVYRTVNAENLWNMLMRGTYDWAEPGVLFLDRINDANNLHYCETISATNPCGEQPLPPYGACLLGSQNLVKYLISRPDGNWDWDMIKFEEDLICFYRAMDNVIDKSTYPLEQQETEAKDKRRMGIGITGTANAIEAIVGHACYGEDPFLDQLRYILSRQRDVLYSASVERAKAKGSFPALDRKKYLESMYIQTLPEGIREGIAKHGIRNSHLTSIAPTGTISLCADNVSSGIEPVFSYEADRTILLDDGPLTERCVDYGVKFLGVKGKRTSQVTIDEHINVLTTAQQYVDSAVSKTCNVPKDVDWEDFKSVYVRAFEGGAKGCTTYRAGGKREAMMTSADKDEAEPQTQQEEAANGQTCYIDPATGRRECE